MTIAERIKLERKTAGLTQEQLAGKTGISLMSIRRYESGQRNPNIDTIRQIAAALGVSVESLVVDHDRLTTEPKNTASISITLSDLQNIAEQIKAGDQDARTAYIAIKLMMDGQIVTDDEVKAILKFVGHKIVDAE